MRRGQDQNQSQSQSQDLSPSLSPSPSRIRTTWRERLWLPRWRYGQRLLWSGQDEWGAVEVVKSPLGATLHFGNAAVQGRLNLNTPWRPVTEYGITMAAAAAFPEPISRRSPSDLAHPISPGSTALSHSLLPPSPCQHINRSQSESAGDGGRFGGLPGLGGRGGGRDLGKRRYL